MIRWQRCMQHRQGKWTAAVQWMKEVATYFNAHYPEAQVQVFTARFGALNAIYAMADFQDLAALDHWQSWTRLDEGYRERLRKAPPDLFIEGSIVDSVLESA